ncbi:MAG: N-acetylmuramoyl-L-alanine amidase, partial [Bacteroidales bacterium]|nr:N-acetylmuramoyl-L-alanine amidase [Bacteroidales bacterium]
MPSVLIEVGFLSNANDRTVMNQSANRQKIADGIFAAFSAFKKGYDSGTAATVAAVPAPEQPRVAEPASGPHFEIQILASNKKLKDGSPELKGEQQYQCRFINGLYKYSVGNFSTREEAARQLPAMRKKFPGAFVIAVD